ncbi:MULTISPECIES: hypothetical protein [Metabacillus]|uniref:hypothetical protein n=1 Tax=Metabacillus TaxID=2675233 RepID=UPI000C7FE8FD|nr:MULTISPECIES: hypothetical protein [Metabacillus]MCM3443367.1 hypothetical protein [Metabacillus halosaccharovorans]PMC34930.1 hypothetical protein CJ195_20690 [Bacillus sp. UMB0899]
MCPCMMLKNMDSSMVAIMALSLGLGLALGLASLVGTFYLIWRFIRAIEKRDAKPKEDLH